MHIAVQSLETCLIQHKAEEALPSILKETMLMSSWIIQHVYKPAREIPGVAGRNRNDINHYSEKGRGMQQLKTEQLK